MYRKIEDWMATELKIGWSELLVYVIIYGSQDQTYTWGQNKLAETIWVSKSTAKRALKNLMDRGLIVKVSNWYQVGSNWTLEGSKWPLKGSNWTPCEVEERGQNEPEKGSKWPPHTIYITNNQNKRKKTNKKETKKEEKQLPSVSEIVDAFVEDYWVNDERIVAALNKRLAHKQKTKAPYKTIRWALKQIQETLGWIWTKDRSRKFEWCVNDTISNWWQGLGRYSNSESRFYNWLEEEKRKEQRKAQKESQNKPPSSLWGFWKKDIENILDEMLQL